MIGKGIRILQAIEDSLLVILLGFMTLLAFSQIVLRNLFDSGIVWADPLLRVMVLWLGLMGALAASRDNKHISIDVLFRILPERYRPYSRFITSLVTTFVCALISWHGARFVHMDYEAATTTFSGLPVWPFELVIPLAFGLIAVRYFLLGMNAIIHKSGE